MGHLNLYARKRRELTSSKRISLGHFKLHKVMTTDGGVYRITTRWNPTKSLYIGKAKSLRQRIYHNLLMGQARSHTFKRKLILKGLCRDERHARTVLRSNYFVQFIQAPDPRDRTFIEHYIIAAERPGYND